MITGDGLAAALTSVECVIDAATGPSPEQQAATEFFTTPGRNLHAAGERGGVRRIVVVSIPACVLRASQFHEFVEQIVQWGRQGAVSYVPKMRTQLVAARTVGEALADLATAPGLVAPGAPIPEIAGPREESLVETAKLLAARRGYESGRLLPGPHAKLAGPSFEQWLER